MGDGGHEDDVAPGDRDVAREPGALGAHGLLGDLDHDLLALLEDVLDVDVVAPTPGVVVPVPARRRRPVLDLVLGERGDVVLKVVEVGDVQEARLLLSDVDERRLHPREHAQHASLVDVTHDPTFALSLDVELADDPVFHERDSRLGARGVYDQYVGHTTVVPSLK